MNGLDDQGKLLGRGISFPFRLGSDGRVAWSTGRENIRESIQTILLTDPGERIMLPAFGAGLRSFLFEPNVAATHRVIHDRITHALSRWEGRIKTVRIAVEPDWDDSERANVTVEYEIVATAEKVDLGMIVQLGA